MSNLSVRPLVEADIPNISRYWYEKTDEDFLKMGADKAKLPAQFEFRDLLKNMCEIPVEKAKDFYLIWLIDTKPIGFTLLRDIVPGQIGHMHLHMWDVEFRGKGYGAKLFCLSVLEFYKLFDLKIILCEPRASNQLPNRMLTKIGFKKWKTYVSTSAKIALTCELNSYIVDPKTAAQYLNTKI